MEVTANDNNKMGGEDIFIDDFYYGNIEPQNSKLNQNKLFRKKMNTLSESEKELFESLKEDELSLFESYTDAWSYINSETNRDSFRNGFKIGARFIIDIFAD